ncbi:hypothetical protein RQP46_011284 [Phenoliferia psychrophenolica]
MPHYLHRNLKQLFVSNLPEHVTIGQARNFFDDHEGLAGIFLGSASQKYHNCASWLIFTNSRDRDACLKKLANGVTFPGMKVPLYVEYAEPTKVRVSFKWLDMSKEYRKLHPEVQRARAARGACPSSYGTQNGVCSYYVSDHLFPVQNRPVVLSLNLHINKDNHREDCLVLESRQQLSSGATAAPTEVVRIVPENLTSVQYPSNFPTGKDAIVTFWLRPSAPASLITQLFSMIEQTEPGLDQVSLTVRVQSDLPGGTHCSPDLTKRMHDFCDHVSTHWTSVEARLITGATGEAKAHDFDRLLESHWRKHPRDSPFVKGAGTNGGPESSMEVDS